MNNTLGSDTHVTNICDGVSKILHTFARIWQFKNIHKRRMIMRGFIASEFGYCPLVWMFHSRKLNSRANKIYERALTRSLPKDFSETRLFMHLSKHVFGSQ